MKKTAWFLSIALLCSSLSYAQAPPLRGLDEYIQKAMQDWRVPGMALAVVKDDTIVLSRGYGVRKAGASDPVDEQTMFAIASLTKAFTAASLAMLVEEGKISWDDHAADSLPGFQLYDPYVTREMTVRDLLSHRSGLPKYAPDMLWWQSNLSRSEILQRVRHLQPASSFRSAYAYQNVMFLAAGEIIPGVTGKSWDAFVRERIFLPLGMNRSTTGIAAFADDNVSTPHAIVSNEVRPIEWLNAENTGGAAAINSCAEDMAQWLRFWVNEGTFEGNALLKKESVAEILSPQTIARISSDALRLTPDLYFSAYGLGWGMRNYRGKKLTAHGGALDGMWSAIVLVPDLKLGVVVLTNLDASTLPFAVTYRIVDAYMGLPPRDWSSELMRLHVEDHQKAAEIYRKADESRAKNTKPSFPASEFAGVYQDEMYGEAKLETAGEGLKLNFTSAPRISGRLEHWHHDTFRVHWNHPLIPPAFAQFFLDTSGKISYFKIELIDTPLVDPSFSFSHFTFRRKQE